MAPARSPCTGHAAHAATAIVLRVAHGLHQLRGLLGGIDHGHQDVLRPQVEVLLDERRLAHGHAADRVAGGIRSQGLQLRLDAAQVVGRVFAVDDQPVKPGQSANFGGVGAGQAHPQANLRLLVLQGLLECIHGGAHQSVPLFKGQTAHRMLGSGWRLGRCGKAKRL